MGFLSPQSGRPLQGRAHPIPRGAPRRAMILAAGLGTRMRPLTLDRPKPLLPFWNSPLLERLLLRLADWGVEEVLINVHHQAAPLCHWIVDAAQRHPLKIQISYEPEILGTGGGLVRARSFLQRDPRFWLVNADILLDVDPLSLLRAARKRSDPLAVLWMHNHLGPRTVEVDRAEQITNFHTATPAAPGTATFTGLHLIHRRIFEYLPKDEIFYNIINAYRAGMKQGQGIAGVHVPGAFWADLGTPGQYVEAHREVYASPALRRIFVSAPARQAMKKARQQGVDIQGFAALGENVKISASTCIRNSILWEGCRISGRSQLDGNILGGNTQLHRALPGAGRSLVAGEVLLSPQEGAALRQHFPRQKKLPAVEALPARGSDRAYYRLHPLQGQSTLLVRWGEAREENKLYLRHTRFLEGIGVRAPKILYASEAPRFALMEDLGETHLLDLLEGAQDEQVMALYQDALEVIDPLHARGLPAARKARLPLAPGFDAALYRWEREYFAAHFLKGQLQLHPEQIRKILKELSAVSRRLLNAPAVLIHRDFQSTNLMRKGREWVLIDYQGMRSGCAAYDLASLLCDPYAELSSSIRARLLATRPAAQQELFPYAAVQRLVQALGAYGNLGSQRDTRRFLEFIPPALRILDEVLDGMKGLPTLKAALLSAAAQKAT